MGALAAAGLAHAAGTETGAQEPQLHFPTSARDRLAVTSYPFRTYIASPTNPARQAGLAAMDLKEFPGMAAEKFGIHNINPLGSHFSSTDRVYLASFVKAVADAHSHIVDLGLSGRRFYSADKSIRDEAVKYGSTWIDIATVVGSPSVRQHVEGKRTEPVSVDLAAESLGRLADYGAKRKVVVNLENDAAISEDPFFLIAVIEKVNNPYLRGLPDFGNSLLGHDAAFNRRAVAGMLKHAFNMCHVKDVVESEDGQRHAVDLKQLFDLAKTSGYRGYFSMEFETKLGDPVSGTRKLAEETLQYLT